MTINAAMPKADYLDACDAIREKTGGTDVIKSGDMGTQIRAIKTGGSSQVLVKAVISAVASLFSVYDYETGTWIAPTTEGIIIVSGLNTIWIRNNKYLVGASATVYLKDGSFHGTDQGPLAINDVWNVRTSVHLDSVGYIELSGTED